MWDLLEWPTFIKDTKLHNGKCEQSGSFSWNNKPRTVLCCLEGPFDGCNTFFFLLFWDSYGVISTHHVRDTLIQFLFLISFSCQSSEVFIYDIVRSMIPEVLERGHREKNGDREQRWGRGHGEKLSFSVHPLLAGGTWLHRIASQKTHDALTLETKTVRWYVASNMSSIDGTDLNLILM